MTACFQTTHSHSPLPFLVLSLPSAPRRTWSCQTLSPRSSKISWRGCCRETFPRGWAVRARGTSHTSASSHQPHQRFTSTGVLSESITCQLSPLWRGPGGGRGRNAGPAVFVRPDRDRRHMIHQKPRFMTDFTGAVISHQLMTKAE